MIVPDPIQVVQLQYQHASLPVCDTADCARVWQQTSLNKALLELQQVVVAAVLDEDFRERF
ncbi:MAG TPA: hypothetical protein VKV73_33625 [Chloroflexota bacterium]|nr:hypothetical protein [Chloroflexota bacterium]